MDSIGRVLDFLEWPHLAFLFALVFIILFRNAISGLIARITQVTRYGISTSPSRNTQSGTSPDSENAVQQLLDVVGNSAIINDIETGIMQALKDRKLSVDGDTERILIKHLAGTQLLLNLERIHGHIFGSQIRFLKSLNEQKVSGISLEFASAYFSQVQKMYPKEFSGWDVEKYLKYLYAESLITETDGQIHITNLGVEYLIWMVRNSRVENKTF